MSQIRGVNLGGWLVLEKWMTPSLFKGTAAVDEYTFSQDADKKRLTALRRHRETFITEQDFAWIAGQGLNAVRLPLGYWSFGGVKPYVDCEEYVGRALTWAKRHGLKVLLCVHGAPGSQNGQDHSGRIGPVHWPKDRCNPLLTETFVRQLAVRYGTHPAVWGIELLNEPSTANPKRTLRRYYEAAYRTIRQVSGSAPAIVMSDGFKPRRFKRVLRPAKFPYTYIDTHQYQVFTDADRQLDLAGHLAKTAGPVARELRRMAKFHPVLVGEWSAALDEASLQGQDGPLRDQAHQAYAASQLAVYETTAGWFYWSYRTESPGPWDYRYCREQGWLPAFR